ncbi:MAG: cytochrome c nitrite reductase small subunit [Fimbriimonadaceae bacterium]|nr:cytochrome c nitrite reductase small subunit [Fimbriimonadaceae bacterium]
MSLWSILSLSSSPRPLRLAALASAGVLVGTGFYVARISRATSYLSDDPKTCINCHVMKPYYASWQHSSHGRVASCNDCHVPHDSTVKKYAFKAKDGLRHSTIFTLRREPQVLRATEEAKKVIQANCLRCHGSVVSEVKGLVGHDADRSCIECHREVPHGRTQSLSSNPNALVPDLPAAGASWFRDPQTTAPEGKDSQE